MENHIEAAMTKLRAICAAGNTVPYQINHDVEKQARVILQEFADSVKVDSKEAE